MTDFLVNIFTNKYKNDSNYRLKVGNMASITGIVCNIFLCLIKGIAGFLFNSVAILADAVNNLSDAGNSIISLVGFILSGKPADDEHPYGHARIEYISCLLVSIVIMFLGYNLIKESIDKIINPRIVEVNYLSILVLIISILIKLWMSLFYKKTGSLINSDVLFANSKDSINDVISTSVVLVTSIITLVFKVNLDAYTGCTVALFIIYSGFEILKEVINNLLGTMPDKELTGKIVDKLFSYKGVLGIHDLVVHSYGPDKYFATVHVEVPNNVDVMISHDMIDNIERDFADELNINLVIHLDPVITDDEETNNLKNSIIDIVNMIDPTLSIHDFRMVKGETHSNLIFDVLVSSKIKLSEKEIIEFIDKEVKKISKKLFTVIKIDRNYTSHNI